MSEGIRKLKLDNEPVCHHVERIASIEQQVRHNKEFIDDHHDLIKHVAQSVDQISKEVASINKKLSVGRGVVIGAGAVIAAVWAVVTAVWDKVIK